MSGGSLDYVSGDIERGADAILERSRNPLHVAFAKHLMLCAKAAHELEWVLSGDTSSPEEEPAIKKVLHKGAVMESIIEDAEIIMEQLQKAITDAGVK